MFSYETALKVRFGETDAAGIVFYPNFFAWMDYATHELISASIGISTKKLMEEQKSVPLLEAHCEFRNPAHFLDVVIIKSVIAEVKTKTIKIEHHIHCDNVLLAEGYEIRVWASFENNKPKAVPIPEDVRNKFMNQPINKEKKNFIS